MKIISIISKYPGCGLTTIGVNLASSLARKGYRVLILDLAQSEKLCNWLDIKPKSDQVIDSMDHTDRVVSKIASSSMGIDLLSLPTNLQRPVDTTELSHILNTLGYDYLLIHHSNPTDVNLPQDMIELVIACTNLSQSNELDELQAMETYWQDTKGHGIDLILPNKINTKEWEHNSQQLLALAEYFGYEKIADPIPA
jgi:cellulose biosynthesis protein BcsQ